WEVPRGLALVGCPLGELATRDARSVLSAISGSFAVTWQRGAGGRTCPGLYVEGLGLAPFALAPGRAVLVWSAGGHLP
ncbi:MAG: hypothetical protein HY814_15050, partial [Candidatus Riflebacteria bacterium]|nr:hypothetical protein [Candidatus Riflebacteria bacterium]